MAINISPLIDTLNSLIPTVLTLFVTIWVFKLVIGLFGQLPTGLGQVKL